MACFERSALFCYKTKGKFAYAYDACLHFNKLEYILKVASKKYSFLALLRIWTRMAMQCKATVLLSWMLWGSRTFIGIETFVFYHFKVLLGNICILNVLRYWYFGPLKHRLAYAVTALKYWPPVNEAQLSYVLPCDGCSRCFVAPVKPQWKWWHLFLPPQVQGQSNLFLAWNNGDYPPPLLIVKQDEKSFKNHMISLICWTFQDARINLHISV